MPYSQLRITQLPLDLSQYTFSREEMIRSELITKVQREEVRAKTLTPEGCTASLGLFHMVAPTPSQFTMECIGRGWLYKDDEGLIRSTGLGRCIAELHRNWRAPTKGSQ